MTTPSHAPGTVDVVVTNVDGQNGVAIGAYTFAAPESFDVNGDWRGVSYAGDYDEPFEFTVVNGAVVSMTCSTSGLVSLSPPAPITHGEFLFKGEDGLAVSGRILAPTEAKGLVNIGPDGNVPPMRRSGMARHQEIVLRPCHAERPSRESTTRSTRLASRLLPSQSTCSYLTGAPGILGDAGKQRGAKPLG